ncbi:MAG: MFS transporter [Gammaproteobacteria bacterium]|nr:MFS transporter [Gammaproteobacteria bacterium]MXY64259.1 MFS transporter [Gammaproteobacteria bacterium]MYG67067.1 MFS transporter [Gammaproteobacteria bacterium]
MPTVILRAWALMLGILLLMVGNGLQGTLLGIRGTLEQIDASWMGVIMAAYFIGFLGGSRVTPVLLRRVGHVRVFAALGSLVSAAFILYAAIVDPLFWLAMRLVVGFCFSGLYVVAESWINDMASNETRGQVLSLYILIQMTGLVTGQLLLNVADPSGYTLFVLISVLVSVSFAPILLSVSPTPVYSTARPMSLRELMGVSPLGCVGVFLLGGVFSALLGMSSIYGVQRGLSVREISWFVTAIYIGGVMMQYPVGWVSDRMDRRLLVVIMTALATLFSVAGMFGQSVWWLLAMAFCLGAAVNPLYPLLLAYTNDRLSPEQMASASGGLMFINGVGAMGGPVAVGFLINRMGPNGFFLFLSALTALVCLYSLYRMSRSEPVAVADTHSYIPVTAATTPVAVEMAAEAAMAEEE